MSIKDAVQKFLMKLRDGDEFSGWQLQKYVKELTGNNVFPDSALRKLRLIRGESDIRIICTDVKKSKYIKKSC